MIKKYVDAILITSLIIGVLGIAAIVLFTNRPANVSALSVNQSLAPISNSQNHLSSVENVTTNNGVSSKITYPIAKTKNNIKIEVLSTQVETGYFGADICFDFPSNNPAWSLGDPNNLRLSNGITDVGVYEIDMIPDPTTGLFKQDNKGDFIGRCDHVRFPIDGFALENLKISIGKLVTDMPESPDCVQLQTKLDAKNLGIKVKCINEPGMSGVDIVTKPKNMDNVQAQAFITDALTESVNGPWEFGIGTP